MRQVFCIVLMLLSETAFGHSGSNKLGPLPLPFEFKITVSDSAHELFPVGLQDTSHFVIDIVINPGDTNYRLIGDTILCMIDSGPGKNPSNLNAEIDSCYFRMIFDTTTETISDLVLAHAVSIIEAGEFTSYSLELVHLLYDSTSVFVPDSDLNSHLMSANYSYLFSPPNDLHDQRADSLVSVTSISFAGNFRPATLEGVTIPTVAETGLSLVEENGTEFCIFSPADHPRALERYSMLGLKEDALEVPVGASQVAFPTFPKGLQLLRLDSNVSKVFIP